MTPCGPYTSGFLHRHWGNHVTIWLSQCQWNSLEVWWRHRMETFSVLLTLCLGNSPVGHRWIPFSKTSEAERWYFLVLRLNTARTNSRDAGGLGHHRAHYDVTVMRIWVKLVGYTIKHMCIFFRMNSVTRPLMMTSWCGNDFRITDTLRGESNMGNGEMTRFDEFLLLAIDQRVQSPVVYDVMTLTWLHRNTVVMGRKVLDTPINQGLSNCLFNCFRNIIWCHILILEKIACPNLSHNFAHVQNCQLAWSLFFSPDQHVFSQ